MLPWRESDDPSRVGSTVWSVFPHDTTYFGSPTQQYMVNYRVDDLEALLAKLRAQGVTVDDERYEDENGRFAWITDPDGRRVELWQPAPGH